MKRLIRRFMGLFNFDERRAREAKIKEMKLEVLRRKRHGLDHTDLYQELRRLQGKPY